MSNPRPGWIDRIAMALMRPWTFVLVFAFLLTPSYWLCAALNSGAAFLKIDTGARPAALGGAFTAVADDINALYYNPGGLAQLSKREFGATHTQWIENSQYDFIGYAQPTAAGTFGLGLTRLAQGNFDARDANRQATGGFTASDAAYILGFSRTIHGGSFGWLENGSTSIGANAKLLQSTIGTYSASALAFDLGAWHRLSSLPMSLGFSILNAGQGMRFLDQTDPLPLMVTLGGSYRLAGMLNLALDVRREIYDQRMDIGFGTEYAVLPNFMLRGGYASLSAESAAGGAISPLGGLTGGFGLRFGGYSADYTFSPFGELGDVQRISLGARF